MYMFIEREIVHRALSFARDTLVTDDLEDGSDEMLQALDQLIADAGVLATKLTEALLQPEPEPVMHILRNTSGQIYSVGADGDAFDMSKFVGERLYVHPPVVKSPEA